MNKTIQLYLLAADRVIVPKSAVNWVQHHGIYWGQDTNGQHWFLENHHSSGVRFNTAEQFLNGTPAHLVRVQRFTGSDWQRQQAMSRAQSLLGRNYDLINYNCEHYCNEVQYGIAESKQVGNGIGFAFVSLAICLFGGALALK